MADQMPKRTKARIEFALSVLERHRRNVDAAILALRAHEETRRLAEIALESATAIAAEEAERIANARAAEEADVRARLAPHDATDSPSGDPVPAVDRSWSSPDTESAS